MTQTPYFVSPRTPLDEVVGNMANCYGCVVVMQNHKVVGIFTTVDAYRAFAECSGPPLKARSGHDWRVHVSWAEKQKEGAPVRDRRQAASAAARFGDGLVKRAHPATRRRTVGRTWRGDRLITRLGPPQLGS
ncbi:MAG: hypothetical protein U0235_15190 [Polyangiaceae bacterium]